jgi:hypothetical protein
MAKKSLILYLSMIVVVLSLWFFVIDTGIGIDSKEIYSEQKYIPANSEIRAYTDIIIFSSFSPLESSRLSNEILKLTGRNSYVRILSANHLSSSYTDYDTKSLDFYLSTVLTNTEKSSLNDICNLLSSCINEYKVRQTNYLTKIFIIGNLPEATSKDDPALYCISSFNKGIKLLRNKENIEFFTYINSDDTSNALDRDLISLLSENNYKVSVITAN